MLIFDPRSRWARFAAWVEPRLPLGIPVLEADTAHDDAMLGLTRSDLRGSLWWIGTDGVPRQGLRAVLGCLAARSWAARR